MVNQKEKFDNNFVGFYQYDNIDIKLNQNIFENLEIKEKIQEIFSPDKFPEIINI